MNTLMFSLPHRARWVLLLSALALLLAAGAACGRPTPPPLPPTPTPEPTPTPKTGPATLRIDVQPHGAVVKVNGIEQGQTPITLTLAPTGHQFLIEHEGFAPLEETLTLEPGGEAMIAGMLKDITPPQLAVTLSPPQLAAGQSADIGIEAADNVGVTWLEVVLDGELLEEKKLTSQAVTQTVHVAWTPVKAGLYQLVVRASDSDKNVAGEVLTVTVAEAPTPTTTATPAPPTATPTPIPVVSAEVTLYALNVRQGPDTSFPRLGIVRMGERLTVLARNGEGTWLRVCCVDGQEGWVSRAYVKLSQPLKAIPVATDIPPTPASVASPPVTVRETRVTIPTYPYAAFLRPAVDVEHGNFPLRVLDRAAYEASNPQPTPQEYRLIVLENEFLRLTLLPELGGRVYECIFKPTGHNQFYRNPVIKPTHWGPPRPEGANWWLAAGGLEWGLPVEEHGYEWGIPWSTRIARGDDGHATVYLSDGDGNRLRARVAVTLHPGRAAFDVQIILENPTAQPLRYKFWSNAMLAPGRGNSPSEGLQFIFPAAEMTVHSTGDARLPGPGQPFSWPLYQGRDVSRLSSWREYLGFFARPAAQGDFVGVYDHVDDEGMVRVFPGTVARGAKGFAFGWGEAAIGPDNWTDDGSGYVELHGGVAPTFDDWAELDAGQSLSWQETWFPVAGLGGILHAERGGAINVRPEATGLRVSLFSTSPLSGRLIVTLDNRRIFTEEVSLRPDGPFDEVLPLPADAPERGRVEVSLVDPRSGKPYVAMPPRELPLR
ncbi:MAG: DUF5107 domain-containing protein [Anaerolineae bacterium]|nr:DUF5107 domain-containing protein [Anaerolineae bacterium]